ncbi:MAG: glycosyltransferase family 2 protein [Dysgonamonadaceae bacterium]|jgi:GT2 family glycosyltransferase|nr:glycosyltransferase family 2 protein [Dysgonamonadaceae bacterium]
MKKTAVVILNWNGRDLLEKFLPTVLRHSLSEDCEVLIADNASSDGSVEFLSSAYPDTPLIVFDKNYGFAEGYNKALQQVDSEYVVLLNSDVETTENWIQILVSYLENHPDTAAAQPKIVSYKHKNQFEYAGAAGGFIDYYGYPFCRGRILETLEEDKGQYDLETPVFWATGACLCIRRKDFLEAGGLDARFFAHMEEIDLCWRLNARGRKVACAPSSVVYHVGGASLSKEDPKKTYLNFRNNLLMLYKNVAKDNLLKIFLVRYILDALAYAHLLVQGNFKNAKSVVEAHRDFFKLRPSYKQIRKENLSKTTVKNVPGVLQESILWNYYFKGKKTYRSIFTEKIAP